MSDEQTTSEMSAEDKFFGVKTTFDKTKKAESTEVNLEVVDDRPEEDRRPPEKKASRAEDADDDDELSGYSEKVKKRINKLRYQQHEERRQREAAERMREEAIRVAQQYEAQSRHYQGVISQGEKVLVQQIRDRAATTLQQAKDKYRAAYEEGNTEKILEAQEQMMNAQSEVKSAEYQMNQLQNRDQQNQYARQQQAQAKQQQAQRQAQAAPPPPKPSSKAVQWAEDNPWFQQDKEMTALAFGVHEKLVRDEGFDPESDEYFDAIDRTMRARFPDYFGEGNSDSGKKPSSTSRSPHAVVAPSSRNNGAKPRKVRLNRTQLALAKRLGITPEQYATQLIKESE